jgi:hypothetical protein
MRTNQKQLTVDTNNEIEQRMSQMLTSNKSHSFLKSIYVVVSIFYTVEIQLFTYTNITGRHRFIGREHHVIDKSVLI